MQTYRDGQKVIVCDGCFDVIGPAEYVAPESGGWPEGYWECTTRITRWSLRDGRAGHVCDSACGQKFAAKPEPGVAQKSSTG